MARYWIGLWVVALAIGIPVAVVVLGRAGQTRLPPPAPARNEAVPAPPPVTGVPARGVFPLVALRGRCLIGVIRDGSGLNALDGRALVRGGERYRVYTLTRHEGWAQGGAPRDGVPSGVEVGLTGDGSRARGMAFAVGGVWDALPRVPVVLTADSRALAHDVATLLAAKGIRAPIRIDQALRLDLDGDGRDEVIYTASVPGGDDPLLRVRANTYSVVAVRRLEDTGPRTTLVEGEFNRADDRAAAPTLYRIGACLDVDGDGMQEIIVRWRFGESVGYAVYRVRGARVERLCLGGL